MLKIIGTALAIFLASSSAALAQEQPFVAGGNTLDGVELDSDLPTKFHLQNVGGSDGLGLCVFAAGTHAGIWHNEPVFAKLFDFMKSRPGGGYPSKVDAMVKACAASMGLPVPGYVQHTAGDVAFLEAALKSNRYPCVTYCGADAVFYRSTIAHMVNLVFLDASRAAIHDNNHPGKWLWMSRENFLARWRGNGGGWAYVPTSDGPPPIPVNRKPVRMQNVVGFGRGPADGVVRDPAPGMPDWAVNGVVRDPAPAVVVVGQAVGRVEGAELPTGVVPDPNRSPEWSVNGRPASALEAFGALGVAPPSPHVVVVGASEPLWVVAVIADPAARDKLRASWKPHPNVLLGTYAPEDWRVKEVGYGPGVYLVRPVGGDRGEVIASMPESASPERIVGAVRKADPDYDPKKTPSDEAPAGPGPAGIPIALWAVAGIVLFAILLDRKKG